MRPLDLVGYAAAGFYSLAMILLVTYALHSLWLLMRFRRVRKQAFDTEAAELAEALPADDELPEVLVQLPVFNERDVVHRVIDAAGELDWPRDRLHIQVLDDSTDDSVAFAEAAVARLTERGLRAEVLHRTDRTGFKAGALEAGMQSSTAPYIAIFDADFVPKPDFLRKAIRPFLKDDGLALVQGRWEHHNRDHNMLTKVQAIGIDGHFAVEQSARAWTGLAMNFNGTCGLWRRQAIEEAGGWEHDTLTEDLDLSYRAQMAGWRCTYRMGLDVPGELPTTISAWRSQQFRWAKGSMQSARKLTPRIMRSGWPLHHKLAAVLHMTHYAVHPLMLLSLAAAPIALWLCPTPPYELLALGLMAFLIGAFAPVMTYITSQFTLRGEDAWRHLRCIPALASLGTGIAISNARAVVEAWAGVVSPFVRTPKQGDSKGSYRANATTGLPEILCALWAATGVFLSLDAGRPWVTPLLCIYASGFGWVGYLLLRSWFENRSEKDDSLGSSLARRRWVTPAWLLVLGSIAAACYIGIGLQYPQTWQTEPGISAGLGITAGIAYLAAAWLVIKRPGRWISLLIIIVFGLVFRIASIGIAPSDDLNRYVVEGRQLAYGQNPYSVAPHDAPAQALLRPVLDNTIIDGVNHPTMTAIYPPVTLAAEMFITHADSRIIAMKLTNAGFELLAMCFVLAMLIRQGAPTCWLLLAFWNPIGPLWFAGEGHNDSLMVLFACAALWCFQRGRHVSGLIPLSLAALSKPFAAWLFLPRFVRQGWRHIWIPILLAVAAFIPFMSAGWGLFDSLGKFGAKGHYHGALEPFFQFFTAQFIDDERTIRVVTVSMLVMTLLALTWLALRPRDGDDEQSPMADAARMVAILFLCLPTLYPWYMLALVVFLPFVPRSPGLLLWTAMAPVFWLHGFAIKENGGEWTEAPLVTLLAHTPAILLLTWEACGRPGLPRRAGLLRPDTAEAST